jgi:UDP-glucose 4-epimerase
MNILLQVAGYIGSVVTERLLKESCTIIGIDNFQDSSSSSVKKILFL